MALFDYISGTSDWADDVTAGLGPLSLSVTAGNIVVFIGKWETGGASDAATFTLPDGGRGLSWSTPVYVNNGAADPDGRVGIAWAQVGTTGTASVTGTLSAARGFREFHLHQLEMGASYTPSEIASTTGNSATAVGTWSATSITAAVDDLVAVAVATAGGNFTVSATSPLTLQANAQGRSKFTSGKTASSGSTSLGGSITDDSHVYAAAGFQLRVTSGDTTAPTFTVGPGVTPSSSGGTATGTIDETGSIFYVIVADGASAPSSAQVIAGQNASGAAALESGSATATTTISDGFTGLSASTAYDAYFVARDDEGTPNVQASPTLVNFTTSAAATSVPVFVHHRKSQGLM